MHCVRYVYSVITHKMLLTVLFGLLVLVALNAPAGTVVLLCVGRPSSFLVGVLVSSVVCCYLVFVSCSCCYVEGKVDFWGEGIRVRKPFVSKEQLLVMKPGIQ
jgi:hypothetical protein